MKDSTALSQEAHTATSFCQHATPPSDYACWYLIDQAKHSDVLRRLFEHDPVPIYDLPYIRSAYREQACDGPLIVQPTTARSNDWLHGWASEGKALALYGQSLTLDDICDHFVSLNTVCTPSGDSLFRYADTATLGSLGTSLSPHQRLRILGPLTAIHGCYAGTRWALTRERPFVNPDDFRKQSPQALELAQENILSVEAYRQHLLASALADSHGLEPHTVSGWFRQLETLGAPSEQGLVEAASLLITQGRTTELSENELANVRAARQGTSWSDTLEALITLNHSQEGT